LLEAKDDERQRSEKEHHKQGRVFGIFEATRDLNESAALNKAKEAIFINSISSLLDKQDLIWFVGHCVNQGEEVLAGKVAAARLPDVVHVLNQIAQQADF